MQPPDQPQTERQQQDRELSEEDVWLHVETMEVGDRFYDRLCAQLNAKMVTDERVGPAQTHVLKAGAGWERGGCGRWSE